MTINFNQYVKDSNFLDMPQTTLPLRAVFNCKKMIEIMEFVENNLDIAKLNVDELINFINENPNITKLNLTGCDFIQEKNSSLVKLIENCNIIYLNISTNGLSDEINAIAEALKNNKTLASLDLSNNTLFYNGIKAIIENLVYIPLISLNLSLNNISFNGAKLIAEALKNNTTLTSLDISRNEIYNGGAEAIAKALENNTTLTALNVENCGIATNLKADIETKLQRNKQIKDISELFKAIISKITLGTDGTLLLSWDEEGSDQNSVFNKLKEYNEQYGAFPTTVLEQIIAQSIYQNTVHVYQEEIKRVCQDGIERVYKDVIEQLSFAAKSYALKEVTKTLLKHLGFNEKTVNEFNSKIAGIINEVKEMFMLELDILNAELGVELPRSNAKLPETTKFLYYYETEEELQYETEEELQRDQQLDSSCAEFCDSKNANKQLTNLYREHPDLEMPGTILKKTLESNLFYDNIAQQLKKHAVDQTFKNTEPQLKKLLNHFAAEFDRLSKELEGPNESMEDIEHFNTHLSDTSDTQSDSTILGDNIYPEMQYS